MVHVSQFTQILRQINQQPTYTVLKEGGQSLSTNFYSLCDDSDHTTQTHCNLSKVAYLHITTKSHTMSPNAKQNYAPWHPKQGKEMHCHTKKQGKVMQHDNTPPHHPPCYALWHPKQGKVTHHDTKKQGKVMQHDNPPPQPTYKVMHNGMHHDTKRKKERKEKRQRQKKTENDTKIP